MFSNEAFVLEDDLPGIPDKGKEYIRQTREREPSRLVGTTAYVSVCTSFPSHKMGHTIQCESRKGELAAAIHFECNKDILEYWDQPPPVMVIRTYANGTKRRGSYTSDFLVIYKSGPLVVEVKTEKEVNKLLKKNPTDWVRDDKGVHYLPAEEAFAEMGLKYVVMTTNDFDPVRTANLKLLLQARKEEDLVTERLKLGIKGAFSEQAWMTMTNLAEKLGLIDLTPLLQLIDKELLFISLENELLAQPDSCWIATSEPAAEMSRQVRSQEKNSLPDMHEETVSRSLVPDAKDAERAIKAIELVNSDIDNRTVRRYRQIVKQAEADGISAFHALLPKYYCCGNHSNRLNPTVVNFLNDFIKNEYASSVRMTKYRAHVKYTVQAQNAHPDHSYVSRPTFDRYLKLSDQAVIAMGRGGVRAANAVACPTDVKDREIRASLPFELASVDHYLTDIKCVLAGVDGKQQTAQAWLSVVIDVCTKNILAVVVRFAQPNSETCGLLIRQCVRKHGRLPSEIIVDHGSDFISVYFYSLLAFCGISHVLRPKSHPRYGSESERFFGSYKSEWLCMRPGNTADYKEARAVSGLHSPANTATQDLEQLLRELFDYNEWKNSHAMGIQSKPPEYLLKSGLRQFSCVGQKIEEDIDFIVATAVTTKKYKVDPTRGLHINDLFYWHPALLRNGLMKRPTIVKIEPEDPYRVYALVGSDWVVCLASGENTFLTKDPVARISEAVMVLDGKKARDKAKFEADQDLVRKMESIDEGLSSKNAMKQADDYTAATAQDEDDEYDFDNFDIQPLEIKQWGETL